MDEKSQAFSEIERRAVALRYTIGELCDRAGVNRSTYWRAKGNGLKRPDSWVITARHLEHYLTTLESVRA